MNNEIGGYALDPKAIRVEDVDLWCRFLAAGLKGYNMQEELHVILEDRKAVKRRSFSARINSPRMREKGYRLMGFSGWTCYKPYIGIYKAFIPVSLYNVLHTIN